MGVAGGGVVEDGVGDLLALGEGVGSLVTGSLGICVRDGVGV